MFLDLEREASARRVGLEGGEGVAGVEFLAEDRDDRPQVLEGDLLGAVLAQVAGFDEFSPGDGVGAGVFLADDRGIGDSGALVAIDPPA